MRWEYRTVKMPAKGVFGGKIDENELDVRLNELGEQGWELVCAFDTNQVEGATRDILAIFKRARDH
jgi:hypothetical protein